MRQLVLILILGSVWSQEEGSGTEECDEVWEYVEFLNSEVGGTIENILGQTLHEAKDSNGISSLEESVSKTMDQVMEIREHLLGRITDIRKSVICKESRDDINQADMLTKIRSKIMDIILKLVDDDDDLLMKLKEVGGDLLLIKKQLEQEVMRLLMLPQVTAPVRNEDCENDCQLLAEVAFKIDNLIACAEKDETEKIPEELQDLFEEKPITDIDIPEINPAVQRPYTRQVGVECTQPSMYFMDLISITDLIDKETSELYNQLITEKETDQKKKSRGQLTMLKETRKVIDEVVRSLLKVTEETRQKKITIKGLTFLSKSLNEKLDKCLNSCEPGGCSYCAGDLIVSAIDKMKEFLQFFETSSDLEALRDIVQSDMIKMITATNEDTNNIIIKRAMEGELSKCEEEKLSVYKFTKNPFWMLVNATIISTSSDRLEVLITFMLDVLQQHLVETCDGNDRPITNLDVGPNCEWEEIEAIEKYLEKLDTIIQEHLFKVSKDGAKKKAILGFVEIQGMFDDRLRFLFEEELKCTEEVSILKRQYMLQLQSCMTELMNEDREFTEMSRRERINCTKDLRTQMDDRISKLLQLELDKSFQTLDRVPDFLVSGGGYSPLTDIDIPQFNDPVIKPGE